MVKKRNAYILIIVVLFCIFVSLKISIKLEENRRIKQLVIDLSTGNDEIREKAWMSLEKFGKLATPSLMRAFKKSSNDRVKIDIIQLLAWNQDKRAVGFLKYVLKDNNWRLRFFAAQALGNIRSNRAIDELLAAWLNEDWWQVKLEIAIAVAKIGDPKAVPVFLDSLKSSDINTKIYSIVVLYKLLGDGIYFNDIRNLIQTGDYKTRFMAVWVLSYMKDPKMSPLLQEVLKDNDPSIRELAKKSIEKKNK